MSYYGRKVIDHIDERELHLRQRQWERYQHKLTQSERRRLADNRFYAIKREITIRQGTQVKTLPRPRFVKGEWIEPARNLYVRIGSVAPYKGKWRITFDRVQDFRGPKSMSGPPVRATESIEDAATIVGERRRVGEPERVDVDETAVKRAKMNYEKQAIREAAA